MGNSADRKCIAGVGAVLLNLKIDLSTFLCKSANGSHWFGHKENVESPDRKIGQVNVLYRCNFRVGERLHLYANPAPSRLNNELRPFFSLESTFFST